MEVTAKGKTFTFPDGTDPELIGDAIDEYFAAQVGRVEADFGVQAKPQTMASADCCTLHGWSYQLFRKRGAL